MQILAIDPGNKESAFVIWDSNEIKCFGKEENDNVRNMLNEGKCKGFFYDLVVIEQVACYGMPVGEDIFETVFWSGIFAECSKKYVRIKRHEIKMNLCGSARAKDSNIITSIVDRFDTDRKFGKYGKGTKKNPGPFFGFSKDVWQAFALALTFFDRGYDKDV